MQRLFRRPFGSMVTGYRVSPGAVGAHLNVASDTGFLSQADQVLCGLGMQPLKGDFFCRELTDNADQVNNGITAMGGSSQHVVVSGVTDNRFDLGWQGFAACAHQRSDLVPVLEQCVDHLTADKAGATS